MQWRRAVQGNGCSGRCLLVWVLTLICVPTFWPDDTFADALGDVRFPLDVSADGRRLEDADGRPFLINGDAAWSLMVELDEPQAETYLEDRRQRGFNAVLVNLIERGFGGPANAGGPATFRPENDFTSPNEAYFAHVDWVIDRAARRACWCC